MLDKASFRKTVFAFLLPMAIQNLINVAISSTDVIMLGRYSEVALSASSLASQIQFILILLFFGIGSGATVLTAQYWGKKDIKSIEKILAIGIKIAFGLSLLFFIFAFFFSRNAMSLFTNDETTILEGIKYLKIVSFSYLTTSISIVYLVTMRSVERVTVSTITYATSFVSNFIINYLLIFGNFVCPEWGITGAAVATVAGNFIGILLQWSRLKKLPFKISLFSYVSKKDIWEIIRFAIPSGLQEANFSLSRLLGLTFILSLGTTAFAANQIGIAIEAISTMPGWGVAIACTALVGHSIGENNPNKSQEYTLYSTIIASIFMGILACFFFFIPKTLVSFFINKQEIDVIKIGAICLQVAAFEQIPIAIVTVLGSYFKGIGNPKTPFYVSFFTNWFLRLPIAFYLISILRLPVYIYWFITTFQWLVESVILYYLYRKNIIKR